jgi:transcriptional regulator with XRE-family HTH domain
MAAPPDQAQSPGERILLWRRRRGWKLSDLARRTGLPISTLSRYERDTRDMPASKLRRIADALGVTPNDLLGYPGDRTTPE